MGEVIDVEGFKSADHDIGGETVAAEGAAFLSHGMAFPGVQREGDDGAGEGRDVAGYDEDTGSAGGDDFGGAVEVVGYGGAPGEEGLGDGAGETLAEGGVDQEIHGGDGFGDLPWRQETGKYDSIADTQLAGEIIKRLSKDAITD